MGIPEEKIELQIGKDWQKHCYIHDPNVSMEHFLKIVHTLLDRHAPCKSFNKKLSIYSSNPWMTTGISKSIKVKDNLYKKFSSQTNVEPIGTIYTLSLDAQRTHITMALSKQSGKKLWN